MINKALIIGINYIGTEAALNGCINDGQRLYDFLISQGWNPKDIRFVNDKTSLKPTFKNVLESIDWLIGEGSFEPKNLVFHYSGHGTQVKDKNFDEQDGLDEALYLLDRDLTDDVLSERLLSKLRSGDTLTALFDCCHCGTIMDMKNHQDVKGTVHTVSACMDFQYAEEG